MKEIFDHPKAGLIIAIIAFAISLLAYHHANHSTTVASVCGYPYTADRTFVTCTGSNPPPAKFGSCAPQAGMAGHITAWDCKP